MYILNRRPFIWMLLQLQHLTAVHARNTVPTVGNPSMMGLSRFDVLARPGFGRLRHRGSAPCWPTWTW
jgi:hypothetical protein